MLYQTGAYHEALENYQSVLASSPNRLNSLLGLAHTAERMSSTALADHYHTLVRHQTKNRNGERADWH